MVKFVPCLFFPWRKSPQFPLNKRLYRPQCLSRSWRRPSWCHKSNHDTLILWSVAQSLYGMSNSGSSVFHCVCDRWTKYVSWQYHRHHFWKYICILADCLLKSCSLPVCLHTYQNSRTTECKLWNLMWRNFRRIV